MAAYNNIPTKAMMWSLLDHYRQLLGCKDPEEYLFDLDISYNDLTQKIEVVFTATCDHTWERINEHYGPPIRFKKGEKIYGPFSLKGPTLLLSRDYNFDDFAEMRSSLESLGLHLDVIWPALASLPNAPWRNTIDPTNIVGFLCTKVSPGAQLARSRQVSLSGVPSKTISSGYVY